MRFLFPYCLSAQEPSFRGEMFLLYTMEWANIVLIRGRFIKEALLTQFVENSFWSVSLQNKLGKPFLNQFVFLFLSNIQVTNKTLNINWINRYFNECIFSSLKIKNVLPLLSTSYFSLVNNSHGSCNLLKIHIE